jgi:hypothetical protein
MENFGGHVAVHCARSSKGEFTIGVGGVLVHAG